MNKLLHYYLKPHYSRMTTGFVIKFIGTIMDLFLPWILAHMIDVVIPLNERNKIFQWGFLMVLCSVCSVAFNIIANRTASKVASDTTEAVRYDLFEKTMILSGHQVDEYTKPSLISRLTSDTYNLHNMVGRIQRLGVRAPILLIGGIVVTMTIDPVLSSILLVDLVLLAAITFYVSKKSIPLYMALQESVDRFVRIIREDIAGIRVIKALSTGDCERMRYDTINEEVVNRERTAGMTMAITSPATSLFLNIGLVFVIILGAYRVNLGLTEVGKILAFLTYFTIILNAMLSISRMVTVLSKGSASTDRIMGIIDMEKDLLVETQTEEIAEDAAHILFDHVSFSYDKVENNLENICFRLQQGEVLGIIGETGSGKSTIVNLLMRLYDVDSGAIYINGENIKNMSPEKLHEKFGVVFQNDTIFENTILENVRLGRELANEQLQEALLHARAQGFIEEKGGKSEEKLNIKGANLSGGQKQRVLIARALAAHPEILILDDSSSALDYKTDAALRHELREHYEDTTSIIIAQRISSIMNADHILVLEDGKKIGYGTHEQLMKDCKIYQEISQSQMGVS